MKFYCQTDRNLLHSCLRVLFQFAKLLKESYITSLKLLVVVKVILKNLVITIGKVPLWCQKAHFTEYGQQTDIK
jgi:hypothetical protein